MVLLNHMKYLKTILVVIMMVTVLSFAFAVDAQNVFQDASSNLDTSGKQAFGEGTQSDLPTLVGNIINGFLMVLGILLTLIIIRGGYMYMTAGGNTDQVDKAKKWIVNGVIGLVLILLAFAISTFVLNNLVQATTPTSAQPPPPQPAP